MKRSFQTWRAGLAVALLTWLVHGLSPAAITKGPYIQRPSQTGITIMWEADAPGKALVRFGKSKQLDGQVTARLIDKIEYSEKSNGGKRTVTGHLYQAKLAGLTPGTRYYYQVESGDSKSAVSTFRTVPKRARKFTFIALGDSRTNFKVHRAVAERLLKYNPAFIISMGDLVSRGDRYDQWGPQFFKPLSGIIDHIPLWSTLGDHDTVGDKGANFRRFFFPGRDKFYFSFDYGNAHFVSMDYRLASDPEMINWVKDDLARSKATWNFAYGHRPCYNIGGHRSTWGREHFPDIFRKYGVDIAFAGHSHIYERFFPVRPQSDRRAHPVTYITTGGAGAGLYDSPDNPFLAAHAKKHHYVVISIDGNVLHLSALTPEGELIDSLTIRKVGKSYDKRYMSLVKDQVALDVMTRIAGQIGPLLHAVPGTNKPAPATFHIRGADIPENLKLKIEVAEDCAGAYRFSSPLSSILAAGGEAFISGELYAVKKVKYTKWGELIPPLHFKCTYAGKSTRGTVYSARIRYRPQKDR